jgi:hypothetical protein
MHAFCHKSGLFLRVSQQFSVLGVLPRQLRAGGISPRLNHIRKLVIKRMGENSPIAKSETTAQKVLITFGWGRGFLLQQFRLQPDRAAKGQGVPAKRKFVSSSRQGSINPRQARRAPKNGHRVEQPEPNSFTGQRHPQRMNNVRHL